MLSAWKYEDGALNKQSALSIDGTVRSATVQCRPPPPIISAARVRRYGAGKPIYYAEIL